MSVGKLRELIKVSNNIVFFGGAGVSTESNIPDFRSSGGLYSDGSMGYDREYILSDGFFYDEREKFFEFYRENMVYTDARPNRAHDALARLESQNKLKAIITQNIDGLHQEAGSDNVLELHGSIHRNYCMDCCTYHDLGHMLRTSGVPRCRECGGSIKPDVVLYGESLDPDVLSRSREYIRDADMLIVGGTSLSVSPAADLIMDYGGSRLVLINKDRTNYDDYADLVIYDSIGEVLSQSI